MRFLSEAATENLSKPGCIEVNGQRRAMALGIITPALAAIGSLISGFMNYFTDMFLTTPLKATLKHLEETELKTLKGGEWFFSTKECQSCYFINCQKGVEMSYC